MNYYFFYSPHWISLFFLPWKIFDYYIILSVSLVRRKKFVPRLKLLLIELELFWVQLMKWLFVVIMASRQGSKSKKSGLSNPKALNSPSSSTTSSSKQFLETSIDGQSSPASSSALSKPQYFYSESLPADVERSKENVTVTVRFRPLRCFSFLWVKFN